MVSTIAERGAFYVLLAWDSTMLLVAFFTRSLLSWLSGGRTVIPEHTIRRVRFATFCAFLIGVFYLWKRG
jgi:hypothetical protein